MLLVDRSIPVKASFVCLIFCANFFALYPDAWAKEPSLTAIELYQSAAGTAYTQLTNVTINGKSDVRLCGSSGSIDKNGYGKLQKVTLAVGMSLERTRMGSSC